MSDGRLRADARYSRDTTPASTESTPGPFLRKLELFLRATMVALLTLVAGGFILAALEWTGLWLISDGSEKEDRSLVSAAKEKPEIDRSALAAAVFKKGQHSGRFNDLDFANAANIAVYNDIVAWAKSPRYIKELTAAILLSVELIHRGNPRGTDTDFISNYGIASAYCMVLTLQTDPELAREGLFGVSDRCFAQLNVFDH